MVCTCFVCKWRADKQPRRSFHKFPSNPDQRQKWLDIIGKSNVVVGTRTPICSIHFEESCFKYGLVKGMKLLKPGSLPSLYLTKTATADLPICETNKGDLSNIGSSTRDASTVDLSICETNKGDLSNIGSSTRDASTADLSICEKNKGDTRDEIMNGSLNSNVNFNRASCSYSAPMIDHCYIDHCYTIEPPINRVVEVFDNRFSKKLRLESLNSIKAIGDFSFNSSKLIRLKTQLSSKSRQIRRLRQRETKLKARIKELEKKNKEHEKEKQLIHTKMGPIPEALYSQLKSNKKRVPSYPLSLRLFASTMSFLSIKAYKYLKSIFPSLPHPATLRRWVSQISVKPGICIAALDVLKEKQIQANKNGKKLLCSVAIDDMAVRKFVRWNGEEYTEFATYNNADKNVNTINNSDQTSKSFTRTIEVMVMMAVCLNENWKIPVAYHFIDGSNSQDRANIVLECLSSLHSTGIDVVSLTLYGGLSNIRMVESFGVELSYTSNFNLSIPHPITQEPVFIVFDACHAIKFIRNTLADKKILSDGNGNKIEWDYFKKLLAYQNQYGLHAGTKIKKRHINFNSEKMKVKLAIQLLSSSVSKALTLYRTEINIPEFSGSLATEKFCMMINNIFDLLNSRKAFAKATTKSSINRNNITEIKLKVAEYESYIKSLYLDNTPILCSKRRLGFFSFIISMHSSISIFEKYASSTESPLQRLLTYKLSQDHLQQFLSSIRARGGHNNNPTTEQFESAFKWLLLSMIHIIFQSSNTQGKLKLTKTRS